MGDDPGEWRPVSWVGKATMKKEVAEVSCWFKSWAARNSIGMAATTRPYQHRRLSLGQTFNMPIRSICPSSPLASSTCSQQLHGVRLPYNANWNR